MSSVVVVPLIADREAALGAMYFTLETPCEFVHIQDTLLVCVWGGGGEWGKGGEGEGGGRAGDAGRGAALQVA